MRVALISDAFLLDPEAGAEIPTERQLVQREWSLSRLTEAAEEVSGRYRRS